MKAKRDVKMAKKEPRRKKNPELSTNSVAAKGVKGNFPELSLKTKMCCKNAANAFEALKQFKNSSSEITAKTKKPLFPEEDNSVFINFVLKKIPANCGLNALRIYLPNNFRNPKTTSVCLFTKDLTRKWDSDVDKDAREFKQYLTFEKDVDNINEVISLSQLKREYREPQAKRRLCSAYDMFLVDQRVAPHVHRNLGKTFLRARKIPTPISMHYGDVKTKIDNALRVVVLTVQEHSVSSSVQIGYLDQPTRQLIGNFREVLKCVSQKLPGGSVNIRSIGITTGKPGSPELPIYYSAGSKKAVKLGKYQKNKMTGVEGELSTLDEETFGSSRVKVYPDGRISFFDKDGNEVSAKDLDLSDGEDSGEKGEEKEEIGKKRRRTNNGVKEEDFDEDDIDTKVKKEEIEAE